MHSTRAARPARARRYAMLAGFATATAWPLGSADAQPAQAVPQAPAAAADPTASAPAVRLPELRVEGARETATGPVAGYVAERSATGTKTDTPLIETPQSVSVITSDRIQAQNIDTLNQAMLYTPGVFATSVDFRGEYFNLRGFAADIYLDGLRVPVPVPAQSFRIEPWGMERIEVLRGASSGLYGQANLGGIVNAVSKRPRPDMVSQVAIQGGSFGRIQGMFDVGGAAGRDGSLLWRFNGLLRDSDTYVDFGRDNRIYLAPSLAWRPTADTSLTVLASYLRDDLGVTGQWLLPQGTVLPNPNGTIPRGRSTGEPGFDRYRKSQYAIGTILEHRLNADWAVRQNLRYTYQELDYATIFTDLTFVPPNQQRVAGRSASYQAPLHWSVAIDNQAEGRFRTGPLDHRVLFGLDYRVQRSHNRTWTARAQPLDLFAPVYGINLPTIPRGVAPSASNDQTQQQIGFYAQDQIRVDRWILTLTGRQDWADTATRNNLTNRDTTQRDSAFTGRAALLYASVVGLSPYFSYSTSFLPTLGNFAPARGGNPFVPTTGEQFEAGLKFQPPGTNCLITGTFYQLTQQNALSTDPLNIGFSIQTGEVRSRGFELEATASLAGGLNLIAAWTVQDVEITKNTTNNLGLRPLAVPSHMAALWGDYSYRVSDDLTLGLGGGVRYIGNTLGNNTPGPGRPVFNVPSYTVFDAMVRADWRQWRLQLNAFNLGDEAYIQACQGSCYYGPGRAVYATLAYQW